MLQEAPPQLISPQLPDSDSSQPVKTATMVFFQCFHSYPPGECSLMSWVEKRLFTLLVGDVPRTACGCHAERGLPCSPAKGTRFKMPGALYLPQSRAALCNFGRRGFSPAATRLSPCTAWEDRGPGICSREQAPKNPLARSSSGPNA